MLTRPTGPSCRASTTGGATPRKHSFAGCTLGCRGAGRPGTRGRRFDLRRTLRAGLQTGGEALSPRWLRRPRRTPRFVVLVDGSRSMSAYARTTLTIAVALASATRRIEVFTFSTGLERVTTPSVARRAGSAGS